MPTEPRPTKAFIEALVSWAGGSISSLPYSQSARETTTARWEPQAITSSGTGAWGQFYSQKVRELNFHRLTFHDEVRGDAINQFFPPDFPIRLPSKGPAKSRGLYNQVFVGDPQIKYEIPESEEGSKSREDRERAVTDYLLACFQADERNSDNAPIVWAKVNCLSFGLGAISTVLDVADWPKEPTRKKGESQKDLDARKEEYHVFCTTHDPFATKSLSPLNVCYDRSHSPPRWAFTRETITPWDAIVEFPTYAENIGGSPPSPGAGAPYVKTWYWTKDWCACYINGEVALGPNDAKGIYRADNEGVAKNPYGFIPMDFAPGGHGHQDPDGLPEWELRGMYSDVLDLLLADASCFNQEEIQRQKASYGQKVVVEGPDPIERAKIVRQVMSGPAKVVEVDTSVGATRVYQLDPMLLSPILNDQRNRLSDDIDQATVHDIASGAGGPTEAARRTALRLHQIDKQALTAALNLEQMLESNMMKRLQMVKYVYKRAVGRNMAAKGSPAKYASLDPDDISPNGVVTVKLLGETDEEQANLQALAGDRLERKTLDRHTAMTDFYKDKHPDRIIQGLLDDSAFENVIMPAYLQWLEGEIPAVLAEVAAEEGIIMSNEELQAALPPPQPQIDPMTGMPLGPGGPIDPMAQGMAQGGPGVPMQGPPMPQGGQQAFAVSM